MIETTQVLTETPAADSDILSDVLDRMSLSAMVLFRVDFTEPWSVIAPTSDVLGKLLPFRTEHVIPFHVVSEGRCWLEMPGGDRVWLGEGDAVLLPYGDGRP